VLLIKQAPARELVYFIVNIHYQPQEKSGYKKMYVTSIEKDVMKLNSSMNKQDYELFKQFIFDYNLKNDVYCFCEKHFMGFAIYYCSDFEIGAKLSNKFFKSKDSKFDENTVTCGGKSEKINKFIANFHTKNSAEIFAEFLKTLDEKNFLGFDAIIRSSVVYWCIDSETGYKIAKRFESQILDKLIEEIPVVVQEEHAIHPLDDEQKVVLPIDVVDNTSLPLDDDDEQKIYEITEVVVENQENTVKSKIFNIFRSNDPN